MLDYGKWKIVRSLPEGGQGHTFVVVAEGDQKTERVLKRLKNLNRRDRFEQELRACQALNHPNVLRVIDFDLEAPKPYFVTEYCELGTLADTTVPLGSVLEVLEMFRAVCAGVAHAHQNKIYHRDLKPQNIYLRRDRTPVVGDFGLCFIDEQGERLTATLEQVGSRFYMCPELADGRSDSVSPDCDVYSLGKVLYWTLSGKVFDREKHRDERYLLGKGENTSPEWELINELLDRMIVVDPGDRFQTAGRVASEVDRLIYIIRAGGHAIGAGIPQRCVFCAQGKYQLVANGLEDLQKGIDGTRNSLGLSGVGSPSWLIMVCETCGNVQIFRPDLAPEAAQRWQRKT